MSERGIRLHFKIDEDYFLVHLLTRSLNDDDYSSTEHQEDIVAFKNEAWRKDKNSYHLLMGDLQTAALIRNDGLARAVNHVSAYLDEIKQSPAFRLLILQTQSYLHFCEEQWLKNYPIASAFIEDITGLKLDKDIDVYVTHPNLRNGDCLVKYNIIEWGHHEDWPNYQTVYLWHEVLHSYVETNYATIGYHDGISDFVEGIAESMTDEMLRSKLNNEPYEPFVGREELISFKRKLLPMLKSRMKAEKPPFADFLEQAKQMFLNEFQK